MPITDEATDAAFETFGEEAAYAAPGDDPQPVTFLRDRFNTIATYGDTPIALDPDETVCALVRAADVATPKEGATLVVGGSAYVQIGAATFRQPGLWRMNLRRVG